MPGNDRSLHRSTTALLSRFHGPRGLLPTPSGSSGRPEWTAPLFCGGHWNPELIELAGGIDVFANHGNPGRQVSWTDLQTADPDVLFFACCGFSLDRAVEEVQALTTRKEWPRLRAVRTGCVWVANGNAFFSRPGPRLIESLEILAHALRPDTFDLADELGSELVEPGPSRCSRLRLRTHGHPSV